MKKRLLCIIVIFVVAGMFTGCTEKKEIERKGISVAVLDNNIIPVEEGTYESNRWTQYIDNASGVNVTWVPIPRYETVSRYNMLAASNELPDLITEFDRVFFSSFIQRDLLMPLDEVIEQYAPNYRKYMEENSELKDFITYDAQTYLLTSKRSRDEILNYGAWIRKDWLDKLGLEVPKSVAELLQVARAFRDNDPDGNGVNDTIAIVMAHWQEAMPYLYQAGGQWYDENGTLKYGHTLDRYGEAFRFMKTAYDEGLLDKDLITDRNWTIQKELWETGRAGIFIGRYSTEWNRELLTNHNEAKPVPMAELRTEYGLCSFYKEPLPNLYTGFNKNMKYPEEGMKFIDWMISDGWFTLKFGEGGIHYRMIDGIPKVIDSQRRAQESYGSAYILVSQWQIDPAWYPRMAADDRISQILAEEDIITLEENEKVPYRRDIEVDPMIPKVVDTLNEFQPLRDEIRIRMIVGGAGYSIEQGMVDIRKAWESVGGLEAEQLMNDWYRNNR